MKILLSAIYPFVYALLFFAIPFDNYVRALPNILLGLLVIFFPFVVTKQDFKKLKKTPTILFFAFCLLLFLISLISGRLEVDNGVLQKVGLALLFAILYIPVKDFRKIKLTIILSSLAVIVFSVAKILIIIYASEDIVLGYSREVIEALLMDRLYIGLLSILSILVSYQSLSKKYHPNNLYHFINIVVNVLFIVLMVSKIALLILFFLVLLRQVYSSKKWIRISGIVSAFILGVLIVTLVFSEEKNTTNAPQKSFIKNTLTWEMRTTVWEQSYAIIMQNPLLLKGFGHELTKQKLIESYQTHIANEYKRERFVTNQYNSHNQFLDFYLGHGIFALLAFCIVLFVLFYSNKAQYLPIAFLLVFVSYCLVENIFHRQIGAYYVGFILTALLVKNSFILNKNQTDKNPQ